jgi:hypothetical protein
LIPLKIWERALRKSDSRIEVEDIISKMTRLH